MKLKDEWVINEWDGILLQYKADYSLECIIKAALP